MELVMYNQTYGHQLKTYHLTEEQLKFVKSPEENLALATNSRAKLMYENNGYIAGKAVRGERYDAYTMIKVI